jgi:hypothetical protein
LYYIKSRLLDQMHRQPDVLARITLVIILALRMQTFETSMYTWFVWISRVPRCKQHTTHRPEIPLPTTTISSTKIRAPNSIGLHEYLAVDTHCVP